MRSLSLGLLSVLFALQLTAQKENPAIGTEALTLVRNGQAKQAASLLDGQFADPQQVSDPLSGSVFARLWTKNTPRTGENITLAAAALSNDPAALQLLLSLINTAAQAATDPQRKDALDLLDAQVALRVRDGDAARAASDRLLQRYPDSLSAVTLAGCVEVMRHDLPAWKAMLTEKLRVHPDDRGLLLQDVSLAEHEGDFTRAREDYRKIFSSGKAVTGDHNMYAWISLYNQTTTEDDRKAVMEDTRATDAKDWHILHTQACVDAVLGHEKDAEKEVAGVMADARIREPNAGVWFANGLIAEFSGFRNDAIANYKHAVAMSPPKNGTDFFEDPMNVAVLAHMRLKILKAE